MSSFPDDDAIDLHRAHMLATRAAGMKRRVVWMLEDYGDVLLRSAALTLCARSQQCARCARFLALFSGPYLEVGLIHEVPPAPAPDQPKGLAEGTRV